MGNINNDVTDDVNDVNNDDVNNNDDVTVNDDVNDDTDNTSDVDDDTDNTDDVDDDTDNTDDAEGLLNALRKVRKSAGKYRTERNQLKSENESLSSERESILAENKELKDKVSSLEEEIVRGAVSKEYGVPEKLLPKGMTKEALEEFAQGLAGWAEEKTPSKPPIVKTVGGGTGGKSKNELAREFLLGKSN